MNPNAIYVVIVANRIIQRRLGKMFIEGLARDGLTVTAAPLPGLPTFIEDPYNRDTMRFQFSEHALRVPIKVADCDTARTDVVTPPIPDTPFHSQVFISVVGTIHSGKTTVIRELEAILLADEIPADRMTRYTLDYPSDDATPTPEDQATAVANMRARGIVLLFPPARRLTHMHDVFINSHYTTPASEQT